jgi:Protein of unknown function (DUF3108)
LARLAVDAVTAALAHSARGLAAPRSKWWIVPLALLVTAVHLWVTHVALPDRLGEGAGDSVRKRIDVAFVRELAPTAPPVPAAAPPPPRARVAGRAPVVAAAAAASAPEPVPPPPLEPTPAPVLEASLPASAATVASPSADLPAVAAVTTPDAAASAAALSSGVPQEFLAWPPSTRLTYVLTGVAKGGPVEGQATVEWLRSGNRYQVFMEAQVGPSFAPLMTRRDSSEGEITADGLSPRRYDQETKVVLQKPRRQTIFLDTDRIRLPNGTQQPRPPGVQDSVSQFVHMTWLFTTHPDWLVPGRTIEVPLALPRRVSPWTYEVVGAQTQYTLTAGPVETMHVKPRREATGTAAAPSTGGDLTVELWVAPTLQYLPVRIVIKQDAETYIDLLLEKLPQQAAPAPIPTPASVPTPTTLR